MIYYQKETGIFHLQTKKTSYLIQALPTGHLAHLYWGARLDHHDFSYLFPDLQQFDIGFAVNTDPESNFRLEVTPQEFPAYGNTDLRKPAVALEFADGSRITDLRYSSFRIVQGKKKLAGYPSLIAEEEENETLILTLLDEYQKLEVELIYGVLPEFDVITRAVKIKNHNQTAVKIEKIMSAAVDLPEAEFEFLHLAGKWANERHVQRTPLMHGSQSIASARGTSSHEHNPFVALVSPGTTEKTGEVYAMNLVYSGNFEADATVDMKETTRFQMGINSFDFAWLLEQDQEFISPEVVLVYSNTGLGQMSQVFHEVYQECLMQSKYKKTPRPIALNNWEATYFDFDRKTLLDLAKEGADLGVELFVLDDGWFGQRLDDTSSLGDWFANEEKLGGSLSSFAEEIKKLGLKFGLWFEPEMISPISELYQKHPEWTMQVEGRPISKSRQQYVLDLANPDVQDYIVDTLSEIFRTTDISYVKWDMNRHFSEAGSLYLPKNRQKEVTHRFVLGLYAVLERITKEFPDILFESCSGGGGRFDPGMLYYMPQTWTSDDTDAIERLKIQQGTSMVYPSISMVAHVSEVPNHQTQRMTSVQTRGIVAMQGNFGYEINLLRVSEEEKIEMAEQITFYKGIRKTTQLGKQYRLTETSNTNEYAWLFVAEDEKQVVVSHIKVMSEYNYVPKRLKLVALDPKANYQITDYQQEVSIIRSGDELMSIGLQLPQTRFDYASTMWILTKI